MNGSCTAGLPSEEGGTRKSLYLIILQILVGADTIHITMVLCLVNIGCQLGVPAVLHLSDSTG